MDASSALSFQLSSITTPLESTSSTPDERGAQEWQKHFSMINLNYVKHDSEPWLAAKDYTTVFEDALKLSTSTEKLTDFKDQIRLAVIFEALLSKESYFELNDHVNTFSPRIITDAHYAELLNAYDLSSSTNATIAQTLFCRAAFFVLLSSDSFFGKSGDAAPFALMAYAGGLMVKAFELDTSIFCNKETSPEDNFTDWIKKIDGGGAKGCLVTFAKQLLYAMINHPTSQEGLNAILEKMMPPKWTTFMPDTEFLRPDAPLHALPPVRTDKKLSDHKNDGEEKATQIRRTISKALISVRAANKIVNLYEEK